MDFLDYFLWFFAAFAVVYGLFLLLARKKSLLNGIRQQFERKGNSSPTEEEIDKKLKLFRILGIVCIISGGVLFFIQFTGGI